MESMAARYDFIRNHTNPVPGRTCTDCPAFSEMSGCLALCCEDLDEELDNLAILEAEARGELSKNHGW